MKGFEIYWRAYGGWVELIYSPYFNVSWLLALLLHPLWIQNSSGSAGEPAWVSIAFSLLPSIVGFSLGSIAILVSVSSGKLLAELQAGGDNSLLIKIAAAFFHFLILQVMCILVAIIVKVYYFGWLSFFGMFLLIYALFAGIATASILISVARLRNWIFEN